MLNQGCANLLLLCSIVFCFDMKGAVPNEISRLRRQPQGGDLTQFIIEQHFTDRNNENASCQWQRSRPSEIVETAQFFSDYNSPDNVAEIVSIMHGREAGQALRMYNRFIKGNQAPIVPCKRKRSRQSLTPSPSSAENAQTPFARMRSTRSLSVTSMPSPGLSPISTLSGDAPIIYSGIPSPDFSCESSEQDWQEDRKDMDIDTPVITPMTLSMKAPHPTPLNKAHEVDSDDDCSMGENQEEELPRMLAEDQIPVDSKAASQEYCAEVKRQIRIAKMARCKPVFFTFSPHHIEKSKQRAQAKRERRATRNGAFSQVVPKSSVSELQQEQDIGAAEQDGKNQLQGNQAARKKSLEGKKTVVQEKQKQHSTDPSRFKSVSVMEKAFLSRIR